MTLVYATHDIVNEVIKSILSARSPVGQLKSN